MLRVVAIQIADNIDIKQFRIAFPVEAQLGDSEELFYAVSPQKLVYVFKYGIVCFLGYDEVEMLAFIQAISPYCKLLFDKRLTEEFDVETGAVENKVWYNKIDIVRADIDTLRLVMLNVSQSVALDHFNQQTDILLEETNHFTQVLEKKGRLNLSRKDLKKYIGRTLNLKNRIAANLYIFDSPDETWEDEKLNTLDLDLKKTFDLQARFRTIQEGLGFVKENLELFKDLLQYRNSISLEWIIIALILVEVINLLIERFLKHT